MSRKQTKPCEEEYDDGRTIAPMNVDGMPWYTPRASGPREKAPSGSRPEGMTRRESRAYTAGVLRAALLTVGVFAAVYFLFILFCTNVWFA